MTRGEAIKELKYIRESFAVNEFSDGAIDMAIEALEEPKTGKWAYKTTDAYIQRTCNVCGWSERMYHRNRNQDGLIRNYCPNCGIKMEVQDD